MIVFKYSSEQTNHYKPIDIFRHNTKYYFNIFLYVLIFSKLDPPFLPQIFFSNGSPVDSNSPCFYEQSLLSILSYQAMTKKTLKFFPKILISPKFCFSFPLLC